MNKQFWINVLVILKNATVVIPLIEGIIGVFVNQNKEKKGDKK